MVDTTALKTLQGISHQHSILGQRFSFLFTGTQTETGDFGSAPILAIIGWYSRYVLSWRLSNTLDASFCVEALEEALKKGRPEIFNTDQGSQFTSEAFSSLLESHGVRVSMDGKGSYNDNLFIERLWRTVKYEEVYLKAYQDGKEARVSLGEYFRFYNTERPHQTLGYRTPVEVFGLVEVASADVL